MGFERLKTNQEIPFLFICLFFKHQVERKEEEGKSENNLPKLFQERMEKLE